MDPDNEWVIVKNELINEAKTVGNIARSWQWRERGINPPHQPANRTVLEHMAEDILVEKSLNIRCCDLPGYPRSTFLMVFSPDGTKVASTHGNHNVYVSELASGKHVRILKGHPRTPWCIAFHPSHTQLIGSGCLGGQVRVWDISSGGSEVWNVRNETVIASIAFHPREQLLVIATYNELYFWDWSHPAPFTRVSTNNINEKVRYVAFDALGYKLITGISLWANFPQSNTILQQNPMMGSTNVQNTNRRDDADDNSGNRTQDNSGVAQDIIVNSYQNLVQRYDSLVRNYQRLFMVRHRLTNTPPPPSTIDRGTDPMETDISPSSSSASGASGPSGASDPSGWTHRPHPSTSTAQHDDGDPASSASRAQHTAATAHASTPPAPAADTGDVESSTRLLTLDILSLDSSPTRNQDSSRLEHSMFGSRSSAFQPLTEGRSFRTVDQNERSTRLLPNPFSSSSSPRANRTSFAESIQQLSDRTANTSRTSIFTSSRPEPTLGRDFLQRRRNSSPARHIQNVTRILNLPLFSDDIAPSATGRAPNAEPSTSSRQNAPSTSSGTSTSRRPTMTNSSTQMSPVSGGSVDAQAINESLDLIRDILRDSGTRLLNLITNMSLSTLANVERNIPRRGSSSRAQSDDSESSGLSRGGVPRMSLFSSSSDSDSDQSLEVNIFRTRNATFRENEQRDADRPAATTTSDRQTQPTDRMVFELNGESRNEGTSGDTGGINVSMSNSRFRVRTQSNSAGQDTGTANREAGEDTESRTQNSEAGENTERTSRSQNASDVNPPSTSRDNFWTRGNVIPPEDAYRRVKGGVNALQKHTLQLTNLWLRGTRTSMSELRNMWETLRRRILMLHRETGRQDLPSYYTRSLLERCMMLTEMNDGSRTTNRSARNTSRSEGNERSSEDRRDGNTDNTSNANPADNAPNTSTGSTNDNRPTPPGRSQGRSSSGVRASTSYGVRASTSSGARAPTSLRRRLQSRWRPDDELRRRSRNPTSNRLSPRYATRPRREFARAIAISATRHEIRMRAMQVLSIMFNMMMMCLEERGLSQLIINMLRTLKKALALTCLMLMMTRNSSRSGNNAASSASRVESLNVVRIQNADHSGPINVDAPDEPASPAFSPGRSNEPTESQKKKTESKLTGNDEPPSTLATTPNNNQEDSPPSTSNITQRWSNRLAVQIAAANRNHSATARNRRDLYLESRRLKALHRTNPTAHPLNKKRVLPPVSTHRIPVLRILPIRINVSRFSTPRNEPRNEEPVAGPSTSSATPVDEDTPRDEMLNEFEHRVNLIRLAHLQAVRLRNAARTRFRRLQTIRLYTPSSVREMFDINSLNMDNRAGSVWELHNGQELGGRRSFATYRPHTATPRGEGGSRPAEEPAPLHAVLNSVATPLMQVNEPTAAAEAQAGQPQRLPRIHEYLQPIILAQNAMVVDEEANGGDGNGVAGGPGPRRVGGGMAGLLDAGFISETLPAPSHRVQAWDFTTGDTPDIADSTKNVVVQRCRIHNDASIDISKDGRLLVALLPVQRLRNTHHWLGVYSLEWARLGQCLHTAALEQSAVSVALSPTARYLAVGLGSRRFTTTPHARNNVFALLYRLDPHETLGRTSISAIKELEQNWEQGFTSLNCLRWAPQPGQGLVYANNTGQLIIMS